MRNVNRESMIGRIFANKPMNPSLRGSFTDWLVQRCIPRDASVRFAGGLLFHLRIFKSSVRRGSTHSCKRNVRVPKVSFPALRKVRPQTSRLYFPGEASPNLDQA